MQIILQRTSQNGTYTEGRMKIGGVIVHSIELPWRNNERRVSCIPAGRYRLGWHESPRFKRRLPLLLGVPGRDYILIHAANSTRDIEGCIGLGFTRAGEGRVMKSRAAVDTLIALLVGADRRGEENWIEIRNPEAEA